MSFKSSLLAGALALLPTLASAQMMIEDPYARVSSAMAQSGAAFMGITNHSAMDDRLVGVASDVAERVELHTHLQDDQGIMRMVEVEEGFALPAGESVQLARGGMHVMFLGLRESLAHGDAVEITLSFEHAEPVTVTIPVDLERQPGEGGMGAGDGHGQMGHASDN